MGNISSIHIEKSKENNCEHNDRTHKPSYLKGTSFECNRSCYDARILYNALLNKAVYNYTKRTNQKPQFKEENLRWSAVVNIKSDTTMQDLEKLSDFLNKKYGWQCYQIAIHKDEGTPLFDDLQKTIPKLDKNGNQIYKTNLHAHLEFLMLNENGITAFKKSDFGVKKMRELQTEVADLLGMERGQEGSKAKRLNHQQYKQEQERINEEVQKTDKARFEKDIAQFKEIVKEKYISKKDVKAEIEKARKEWIKEQGHTKEDYQLLRDLNNAHYKDIEELKTKIKELNLELQERQIKKNIENSENANEVINYDRENYGREESYNRQDYDREQFTMYDLSERSMATVGSRLNDLRMSLHSSENKELSAQSDTGFYKKCDFLYELCGKAKFINNGFVYSLEQWESARAEFQKTLIPKTVEVQRALTNSEVENHVRFKALEQEFESYKKTVENTYKQAQEAIDFYANPTKKFALKITAEDLKRKDHWFSLTVTTEEAQAQKINEMISKAVTPILRHERSLEFKAVEQEQTIRKQERTIEFQEDEIKKKNSFIKELLNGLGIKPKETIEKCRNAFKNFLHKLCFEESEQQQMIFNIMDNKVVDYLPEQTVNKSKVLTQEQNQEQSQGRGRG